MDASQLVVQSYYLSDIVARNLETVSGSQLSDGIEMLNEILDDTSSSGKKIPFDSKFNFTGIPGQEEYFIDGLLDVTSLTFFNANVRYSMRWVSRDKYHGSTRVEDIDTYPGVYTVNREVGGATVSVYFNPDSSYEFEIWGKFFLANVTPTTDISPLLPKYFIVYLRYALANRICQQNNVEFAPQKMKELEKKERKVFEVQSEDLSIRLDCKFNTNRVLDYSSINIFRGLWPS